MSYQGKKVLNIQNFCLLVEAYWLHFRRGGASKISM